MLKEYFKKISRDTFIVLILNSVNYLCSFLLAVFIARFLGIESLGEYTFIIALATLLGVVCDFGFSTLLIRKISENRSAAYEFIFKVNIIKTVLAVILFLFLILFTPLFYKNISYPAFIVGLSLILPRAIQSTYEASLRSFLNQVSPAVIRGVNSILQLTGSLILLINGYGIVSIFILIFFLDLITVLILKISSDKIVSKIYEGIVGSSRSSYISGSIAVIKEGYIFFVSNFFMLSIKSFNVILLGYLAGTLSVGIYSAGARFANAIGLISGAIFNSFYPVISNLKNDLKLKTELTKKFILYAFAAGAIITLVLFNLADFLIDITFKNNDAVIVLKILSFTIIPVLIYTLTQSFLFSIYNEKYLLKILTLAWSLNIILSIVLIIAFDYAGCAIALTVTEIFLMTVQLNKFISDIKNYEVQNITIMQ